MNSKIRFVTFGDGSTSTRLAARRLASQALSTGFFNLGVQRWNLKDVLSLTSNSIEREKYFKFVKDHPKGLGLWFWKSILLNHQLASLNTGELLCMLDAGCQFNLHHLSTKRWKEYIQISQENNGLFMQLVNGQFGIPDLSEYAWTKRELISEIGASGEDLREPQVQAGIIFIRKGKEAKNFSEQWKYYSLKDDFSLLLEPDLETQSLSFMEHRYEQSILSLLVKRSVFARVPDETYFAPDWNTGISYPIWAMRNKSGGDAARKNRLDSLQDKISILQQKGLRIRIGKNYF